MFEHKSYHDHLTGFQLLAYMVQIWKLAIKQKPLNKLPVIIPLVIYHGKESWKDVNRFSGLIGCIPEELKRYLPDFEYLIYDLSQYSDDDLKCNANLKISPLLLKYIFQDDIKEGFEKAFSLFHDLEGKEGFEYLKVAIRYVLNAADGISIKELTDIIEHNVLKDRGGDVMTIAEQLRQDGMREGMLKGRQEGRQEEAQEFVLDALEIKFGSVSEGIKKQIKKIADIKALESLHRDAVKADVFEEFINALGKIGIDKN